MAGQYCLFLQSRLTSISSNTCNALSGDIDSSMQSNSNTTTAWTVVKSKNASKKLKQKSGRANPNTNLQSDLIHIPAELREMIWKYALTTSSSSTALTDYESSSNKEAIRWDPANSASLKIDERHFSDSQKEVVKTSANLSMTCWFLYKEIHRSGLLYKYNTMRVFSRMPQLKLLIRLANAVTSLHYVVHPRTQASNVNAELMLVAYTYPHLRHLVLEMGYSQDREHILIDRIDSKEIFRPTLNEDALTEIRGLEFFDAIKGQLQTFELRIGVFKQQSIATSRYMPGSSVLGGQWAEKLSWRSSRNPARWIMHLHGCQHCVPFDAGMVFDKLYRDLEMEIKGKVLSLKAIEREKKAAAEAMKRRMRMKEKTRALEKDLWKAAGQELFENMKALEERQPRLLDVIYT